MNPKNQVKRSFGPQILKKKSACRRKRCFAPHEPRRGRSVLTPPETAALANFMKFQSLFWLGKFRYEFREMDGQAKAPSASRVPGCARWVRRAKGGRCGSAPRAARGAVWGAGAGAPSSGPLCLHPPVSFPYSALSLLPARLLSFYFCCVPSYAGPVLDAQALPRGHLGCGYVELLTLWHCRGGPGGMGLSRVV